MTVHAPDPAAIEPVVASHWLGLSRLFGLLLLALGLQVMAGWLLQVRAMVEIRHGLVAMEFNTALCFALSGLALALPGWHHRLRQLPRVVGLLLCSLCGLVLIEHAFGINLVIDWDFLHVWLLDGNTHPGRQAPNTVLGFLLAGVCLIVLNHLSSRERERLFQIAVFCLLAVGLTGLIGYSLSIEQLFGWPRSARMALHTAAGMIVLALGLWSVRQQQIRQHEQVFLSEDERIAFMSAAVMYVVALVAGLTGFAFQQSILEATQRDKLQFRFDAQLEGIQTALSQAHRLAARTAQDPRWPQAVRQRLAQNRAAAGNWPEFDALLGQGFDSAHLSLPDGTTVHHSGRGVTAVTSAASVASGTVAATGILLSGAGAQRAELLWERHLVLRSTLPLIEQGKIIAHLTLVQAMPALQKQMSDVSGLGNTGEVMLCGAGLGRLTCLPAGRSSAVFQVEPRNVAGQPLPVSLAVGGQSGIIRTLDSRGQNVLAAFAPVGPNLGLAVKQQSAELYGVIRNQLLLLIPALLLLLIMGSMVMRWQLKPLVQRLRSSEAQAREQQLEINTVLESVGEGILTINEAGIIESFNLAAGVIFGYSAEQVIGQPITILMPEELRDAHVEGMARYRNGGMAHVVGRTAVEMIGLHQNGHRFTLGLTINEIQLEARRIFVGVVRDVTESKRTEEKLIFLAQYDILTGLPNRALFMDRLTGAILRTSRSRTALAVMFLDLDGFKAVNDTLGHHSGDDLLRKFAERLSMAVRKSDSVARLGGDEFTVVLEGMTHPERDTREVAEKIIATMQPPFELGTHLVRVTTSIGIAIHEGDGADLNELLRRADGAMYRAKQRGKNCWSD